MGAGWVPPGLGRTSPAQGWRNRSRILLVGLVCQPWAGLVLPNPEIMEGLPGESGTGSGENQRHGSSLNPSNDTQKDKISVKESKPQKVSQRNETMTRLYVPGTGQQTVPSWLVDMGTLQPRERVYYLDHESKKALLYGDIVGGQILCDCCYLIVSISVFEAHSRSKICDALKNIYLEGRRSILQCLEQTWIKQDGYDYNFYNLVRVENDDQSDDISCDGCKSEFHQSCMDVQTLPSGDWHCKCCSPCKFCGEQKDISDGLDRSMNTSCCICRRQRNHQSCIQASGTNTAHSKQEFFCGNRCKELYERLENLFGVNYQTEDVFSWSFICRSYVDSNAAQIDPRVIECNSKLGVALSVMNECFFPCIDGKSRINLMRSVIYNSG
ncbi:hypothetical protein Fmac_029934 [Flemingia macrophylla]|uniref:Tify domain-containing protein n=1 Tax=Flemingia macrophylla TaxID=520843 RepID=A0ABD1LBR7_9FABA